MTRPIAATLALVALLACSGLGTCWKQFSARAHDCCTDDGATMTAPAKPCASAVEAVAPPTLTPTIPVALAVDLNSLRSLGTPASAFAPSFPVKVPPLVLRI